ncbi:hypothetical protein C8Q80DRAFT_1119434 [Daedaleopsis nitida]|nr:hypothetical protein C8Q80DRAFT_1119434 [Daedaleopsis nitida]
MSEVLPPLFVDQVSSVFKLSAPRAEKLHVMVHLGSVTPALSKADLSTRTYIFAAVLSAIDDLKHVITSSRANIDDLPAMFEDMKIRLEDTFNLTKEQNDNARGIVKDLVYQANRVKFKSATFVTSEVMNILRTEQLTLRLNNIFGKPTREKILVTQLKRTASSVRNAFRQDIRDSITDKPCSLKQFTAQTAAKYRRGGVGDSALDIGFTIHNALLRRFAIDNPHLLNIEEAEDGEGSDINRQERTHVDSSSGPAKKKRKTATTAGGRVPTGQDFWSQVDRYFGTYVTKWGKDITSPGWKSLVDDIISRDKLNFPEDPAPWTTPTSLTEPQVQTAWDGASSSELHMSQQPWSAAASSSSQFHGSNLASLLNGGHNYSYNM